VTNAPKDHDAGAADAQAVPAAEAVADDVSAAVTDAASGVQDQAARAASEVKAVLEEVTRERDTYLDHLRRERAEFENFRRRSTRERMEALDRGAEALASELLSVLDNFGYVLEAAKDADDAVAKGVRMVHDELRGVLERAGLEDVPGVDAPFDPTWHDAVMQVDGDTTDEGEPKVAQVLRNGYRFKGRVLRPAAVAVTQ
jgi:molecular chaperone GrpE